VVRGSFTGADQLLCQVLFSAGLFPLELTIVLCNNAPAKNKEEGKIVVKNKSRRHCISMKRRMTAQARVETCLRLLTHSQVRTHKQITSTLPHQPTHSSIQTTNHDKNTYFSSAKALALSSALRARLA